MLKMSFTQVGGMMAHLGRHATASQEINGCWELFCLEHGMQPDGQLPPDQAADCSCEAVITSPKVSGEIPPMPHGVMADLSAMVVDDVCTGISRQPFPTELLFTGMEDAANSFGRGCYAMRPKFVDPDTPADNRARLQPGQVRSGAQISVPQLSNTL
ncbi:unnamed protein product [Symbiodinium microadriaticum]|nr:unnamed protein product [Symbiodinium microadriaticum]